MTTGFRTEYGGSSKDLDELFAPGDSGASTGFFSGYRGVDVGRVFAPLAYGSRLSFNTGFKASDGRDLADWFAAAGTVGADGLWPVSGGYVASNNGQSLFVTDTIAALTGRLSYTRNSDGNNAGISPNLVAARFAPCPGEERANVNDLQTFGGFISNGLYSLPLGSGLRLEIYTDGIGGSQYRDMTVAAGVTQIDWFGVHSGAVPLCTLEADRWRTPINVYDFSPAPGTYYAAATLYLSWTSPTNWSVVVAGGFCCNEGDPHLNVLRCNVKRAW